jgi:hypothetical protein
MVTASLRFVSSTDSPHHTFACADDARLEILNTLNWYEAHGEYTWPRFAECDFSQSMRLRRALVSDVFAALHKAGNVRVRAALGTPESTAERAGAWCCNRCGMGS